MPHSALVVLTARPLEQILHARGSGNWRLDAARAKACQYLVCTQNRHNLDFGSPTAPHRAAFLIGRISGVVPAPDEHARWVVQISEYIPVNIPNIWGKLGNTRYPVWYTTLEDLDIDLAALPPFTPVPPANAGMAEAPLRAMTVPRLGPANATMASWDDDDAWRRFDATLAQLDRVPDLPGATDPLAWDEHGLPR